jgi:hypothetical protein
MVPTSKARYEHSSFSYRARTAIPMPERERQRVSVVAETGPFTSSLKCGRGQCH